MEKPAEPHRYWTSVKIRRLSLFLIIITLGTVIFAASEKKNLPNSAIHYGDFLAFYAAAKIVAMGEGKRLYDWNLQAEVQRPYYQEYGREEYSPYAYPPFFAYLLRPFAAISPQIGKWIWTGLMFLALVGSVIVGHCFVPLLKHHVLPTTAFFILFTPVFAGMIGAQNIALSMLLYAVILWSISANKRSADLLCGLALGLWLYKPQYPLLLLPFFILGGYGYVLMGFSTVALIYYWLGSRVSGWQWPLSWLASAMEFSKMDDAVNADRMISISAFFKSTAAFLRLDEWGMTAAHVAAIIFSGLLFLWLVWKFWSVRKVTDPSGRRTKFQKMLQLAGPALLLISPHTLFYDMGLCFFSCAPHVKFETDRSIWALIFLLLSMSLIIDLRNWFAIQPLFFVVIGTLLFINRRI